MTTIALTIVIIVCLLVGASVGITVAALLKMNDGDDDA